MFRALPPMYVSSTSTSPHQLVERAGLHRQPDAVQAGTTRDFCVMPSAGEPPSELMPFLALAMSQIAASHLSSPSGESSMIVPTLTLNCFLHALHFHTRRVEMNVWFGDSRTGGR